MSQGVLTTALIALASLALPLQATQEFEVASIKPMKGVVQSTNVMRGGPGTDDPGMIRYSNVSLIAVIEKAYDLRRFQIKGGANWIDTQRFEIEARVPSGATKEDLKIMLRRLLADRFGFVGHSETKVMPNYSLVVDKGGSKLKPPAPEGKPDPYAIREDEHGEKVVPSDPVMGRRITLAGKQLFSSLSPTRVFVLGTSQPLSKLASFLAFHAGRPIVDATGLNDLYDFELQFAATGETIRALPSSSPEGECLTCEKGGEDLPDLATALKEQLGLRLEPGMAPLNVLVIERIERTPTGN